ncbi:putative signal peptide protein [Puccinia sorghi]|uniref:Putative signal peptide protein n=1 Tax=Puccinia sorghi TaxID=27349 RepID=A0A0L6VI22_9BASI|nr:putative signal peptide protein [Puccinia sorghi]
MEFLRFSIMIALVGWFVKILGSISLIVQMPCCQSPVGLRKVSVIYGSTSSSNLGASRKIIREARCHGLRF